MPHQAKPNYAYNSMWYTGVRLMKVKSGVQFFNKKYVYLDGMKSVILLK